MPLERHRRAVRVSLLALALVLASACSPARTLEAVALLADVAGEPQPAERRAITYPGLTAPRRAHLYEPAHPRAALVLVPGAAEAALDDPRLVAFAGALARRDFLVLVPELAGDDPLEVSAADAEPIADAVRHLAASGAGEAGIAALSYGAGPAILAALDDAVGPQVGFIVAIGGYHDIVAAITYITTGAYRAGPGEPWRRAAIDRRAKWVFLEANVGWIDQARDAERLAAIAQARRADPDAPIAGLAADLGPEGRAVLAVFLNRDPERVPGLLEALPARMQREIAALDLARHDLGRLEAELILIHGLNDPLVPYTESVSLARARGEAGASLHLLRGLDHVTLGAPTLADFGPLLRAAYRVLAQRDGAGRPGPTLR